MIGGDKHFYGKTRRKPSLQSPMVSSSEQTNGSVEGEQSMEDWEKQKDRLLDNINRAIKQVQDFGCCSSNDGESLTLTNHALPLQQLCQHLDHTFLHGLRQKSSGYWLFVKEFSHKATIDSINGSCNVSSNLGRGRIWLYMALNENALESYARSFSTNPKLIDKYYLQQALLRDQQRLQVMTTMFAGLEYIPFQLDTDVIYLDESVVPLPKKEQPNLNQENLPSSLESSFLSQQSVMSLDSQDGDSGFGTMEHSHTAATLQECPSSLSSSSNSSTPSISQSSSFNETVENHITRIMQMEFAEEPQAELTAEGLEVVEVQSKTGRRKKKSIKTSSLKFSENCSNIVVEATDTKKNSVQRDLNSTIQTELNEKNDVNCDMNSIDLVKSEITSDVVEPPEILVINDSSSSDSNLGMQSNSRTDLLGNDMTVGSTVGLEVKPAIKLRDKNNSSERRNPAKRVSFEIDLIAKDLNFNCACNHEETSATSLDSDLSVRGSVDGDEVHRNSYHLISLTSDVVLNDIDPLTVERGMPEGQEDPEMISSVTSLSSDSSSSKGELKTFGTTRSDPNFLQVVNDHRLQLWRKSPKILKSSESAYHNLLKVKIPSKDFKQNSDEIDSELKQAQKQVSEDVSQGIRVDNDALLRLKFNIFLEEEQLYKMFPTVSSDAEGFINVTFVVLTDKRIYLLCHNFKESKLNIALIAAYKEIDYLLLGLNYQTIQIVCTPRFKRFFLSIGSELLTRSIVSSLELAIRRNVAIAHIPSVFTDATAQTIVIKKWIAKERNVEMPDVSILHYVLVHWEDSHLPSSPQCPAGPSREGFLMFRSSSEGVTCDSNTNWKPGYFVLRAGILYQFNDEQDRELKTYIRLHSSDCSGCRRVPNANRPHTFEILLRNGDSLQLAAADEYQASEWLQSFLETVALGMKDQQMVQSRLCCLIIAVQKLFMCREDSEMGIISTLASADISDIVSVNLDPEDSTYCILEFESMEANLCGGDWVLYFSCENELRKFIDILDTAWQELFQIPLQQLIMTENSIKRKCRDNSLLFRSAWNISYGILREQPIS